MNIPKTPVESKPLEKESRKRTERGDRNRNDKGEKLERMEKNVRQNQKGGPKKNQQAKGQAPKPAEKPEETIRTITLPEKMTISELAEAMKVQPSAVVKKLFLQGTMVTVNQEVDFDKAEEIALEFNCICEKEVNPISCPYRSEDRTAVTFPTVTGYSSSRLPKRFSFWHALATSNGSTRLGFSFPGTGS